MFKRFSINNYSTFKKKIEFNLGQITYIKGNNASGKTRLCYALRLLVEHDKLYEDKYKPIFSKSNIENETIFEGVLYDEVSKVDIQLKRRIEILNEKILNDSLEIKHYFTNNYDYVSSRIIIIYYSIYESKFLKAKDIVEYCIKVITNSKNRISYPLSEGDFQNIKQIEERINNKENRLIEFIKFKKDGSAEVKIWKNYCSSKYENLADSEKGLVCIEIFIALSEVMTQYKAVMLILEAVSVKFGEELMEKVMIRLIEGLNKRIQIIFTSMDLPCKEVIYNKLLEIKTENGWVDHIIETDFDIRNISTTKKIEEMVAKKMKTIFLSYCWKDSETADELDKMFLNKNIIIQRDVRDIEYKQSIKEFMKGVRKSDYVLIILSDNYLKSVNCMHEITEFFKDENYRERILPIVKCNANIFDILGRNKYVKYWQSEFEKIEKDSNEIELLNKNSVIKELYRIENIKRTIPEFLDIIADMQVIRFDKNIDLDKFDVIYKEIKI